MADVVELTEMTELGAESLHLVKTGANGFPMLLAKMVAGEIDEATKAEADTIQHALTEDDEKAIIKTLGLCGDLNCVVCAAPLSKAIDLFHFDAAGKARLTSSARSSLPNSEFVFPDKRKYPIHDESHARNALSRAGGKKVESKVRSAVSSRYPGIAQKSPGNPESATHVPDRPDALPHHPSPHHNGTKLKTNTGPAPVVVEPNASAAHWQPQPQGIGGAQAVTPSMASVVTEPRSNPFVTKVAYAHSQLALFLDQIQAQREGAAIKEPWVSLPNPETKPETAEWDSFQSVTLKQVAERLGDCMKALAVIQKREQDVPGDAERIQLAKTALDCALACVARLAFSEGVEADVTKSPFSLTSFSTQALSAARGQIDSILGARSTTQSTEAKIHMDMTQDQFNAAVTQLAKSAVAAELKPLKKSLKKLLKGKSSNNKGEVSEGEIRGIVSRRADADDLEIPGSGVTKASGTISTATVVAEPKKVKKSKVKKEKKGSLRKQVADMDALLQKMRQRPASGGPNLTGTPTPAPVPALEGRQGETVAKSADEVRMDDIRKEYQELLKEWDKTSRTTPPSNRLIQISYEISRHDLAKSHREGETYVPMIGTSSRGAQ